METSILLLVLLGACLVALVLVLIARREAAAVRENAQADVQRLRQELREQSRDLTKREERIESEEERLATERKRTETEAARITQDQQRLTLEREEFAESSSRSQDRFVRELESVAGLTVEEAQQKVIDQVVGKAERAAATRLHLLEKRVRSQAADRAREIIATAVNRLAVETSSQFTVTVVPLPSPDLKGPIIGKEGRNIRSFEALTGVSLVVDETNDHVLLTGFDATRREIARRTLEDLMADGRINPERIETMHHRAVQEVDEEARSSGYDAAHEAGVEGLHPDLIHTLGALRLRNSYGQNIRAHLIESAQLAGVIAAELGADEAVARRAALLHDIGKALTANRSGTHAALGAGLADRCGESAVVVNAIAAHHEEVPAESLEAVIVQIADAISAARPGARRDDIDQHVERMETLERLVLARPGVSKVLAMSAGHEVRVVVEPDVVGDDDLDGLAHSIARELDAELTLPGGVRVTVVRELRAIASTV